MWLSSTYFGLLSGRIQDSRHIVKCFRFASLLAALSMLIGGILFILPRLGCSI